MPPEITELLDEWPEIDASIAKLIRAAISSRSPQRMRLVWGILAARAELARAMR